ncbi:MAG TPA: metal ABC transporter substrate-binding protein [Aggregatilineales bacterium]|nr:metal ABC transporter substrate-binding protein [Aggregatilineales bacterium]
MLLLVLMSLLVVRVGAQDTPLKVAASFSIIADVVQNIGGDRVEVVTVVPNGQDPHSFDPSPRDVAAFSDAAVVFVNGGGFEEGVLDVILNAAPDLDIREVSSCVEILPFMTSMHSHDEDDDHAHDEDADDHSAEPARGASPLADLCARHIAEMDGLHAADHDDHDDADADASHDDHAHAEPLGRLYTLECADTHDAGSCDLHVWSEPHSVVYWALYIRDTLIELDPAGAETYAANTAAYIEALDGLAHDFIAPSVATIPDGQRVLVTNHGTLGYFAARYGFEVVGTVIPGASTSAEPSAEQVAALVDTVRAEGVLAIFADSTVNTRLAEQVASETGVQFVRLYTDSFGDNEASNYVDYIRYNVSAIVTVLGGTPVSE